MQRSLALSQRWVFVVNCVGQQTTTGVTWSRNRLVSDWPSTGGSPRWVVISRLQGLSSHQNRDVIPASAQGWPNVCDVEPALSWPWASVLLQLRICHQRRFDGRRHKTSRVHGCQQHWSRWYDGVSSTQCWVIVSDADPALLRLSFLTGWCPPGCDLYQNFVRNQDAGPTPPEAGLVLSERLSLREKSLSLVMLYWAIIRCSSKINQPTDSSNIEQPTPPPCWKIHLCIFSRRWI